MIKMQVLLVVAALRLWYSRLGRCLRADARPAMTPVGTSSSNGTSVAWFFDSTERVVIACGIGQASGDVLDCKAEVDAP